MQINLNSAFQDFTGKDIDNTNKGKFLAENIAGGSTPNPVKFYDWATALYHGKPINLDQVDAGLLKDWVEKHPTMSTSAKAQLIASLQEACSSRIHKPE